MACYRATKYIFVTLSYQVSTESAPDQVPLDPCDQAWIQEDKHSYVVKADDKAPRLFLFSQTWSLNHRLLTPDLCCLGTLLWKNAF